MSYPTLQNTPFLVAINPHYQDKIKPGDQRFWQFNMTFHNQTVTLIELLEAIHTGYAWTAPHEHVRQPRPTRRNPDYQTTYRVKENVISAQLLALDCDTEDERSTFECLLEDPFINHYAALLHASSSSNILQPRSRVIFLLDQPLDPRTYELALRALVARYHFCDQSVNHAAALFYGARGCNYLLRDRLLPHQVLQEQLIQPYEARLAAAQAAREQARQERLANHSVTTQATNHQIERYVEQVVENVCEEVAGLVAGMGLRHQALFTAALKLGSLTNAAWLTAGAQQQLQPAEELLLEAAEANGYVADYGEDDALRTIDDGLEIGLRHPWEEPLWYESASFFNKGDLVEAQTESGPIRGRIKRFRHEQGTWEFLLDSRRHTWFDKALLSHVAEASE